MHISRKISLSCRDRGSIHACPRTVSETAPAALYGERTFIFEDRMVGIPNRSIGERIPEKSILMWELISCQHVSKTSTRRAENACTSTSINLLASYIQVRARCEPATGHQRRAEASIMLAKLVSSWFICNRPSSKIIE